MSSVLSDKEIQNLLDALKSDSEKIPKEQETEETAKEEFAEMIREIGSPVGKKDIERLLNALSCDPEEIS